MITWVEIKRVQPNPNNPRAIRDARFEKLKQSIIDFPEMLEKRPLVCYTEGKNYIVLGGNMRLKALQDIGHGEVPIMLADDWSEEQRAQFLIKDNVGFGEWDWNTLANEWDAEKLEAWGLELPPMDAIELAAEEDDYEMPEQIETDIVLGDLFEIGEHRLLCGDSTDSDTVARLMNGNKADMVFTDPPYGVSIVGTKNNSSIAGDLSQTAIPFSFEIAVNNATKDDGRLYFCGAESNLEMYQKLFQRYCRQMPRHLIWVKETFVMKPNGYHNQYEIIYHGYKPKGGGLNKWFGGRTEDEASDVWQIKRDNSKTYQHPTQKPIALPERAIKNSCPDNGLVYEPFTGSGSTMVAAHQLKRKCYGIELDPKYCQVIIDRMIKLDPTLEIKRNGQTYNRQTTDGQ
jgi:DNA modification methylase